MATFVSAMFQDERGRPLPIVAGAITSIGALLCGAVGIVLLVKWLLN